VGDGNDERVRDEPHNHRIEREEAERRLHVQDVVGIPVIRQFAIPQAVPLGQLVGERVVAQCAVHHPDDQQQRACGEVDGDREPGARDRGGGAVSVTPQYRDVDAGRAGSELLGVV